MQQEFYKPQQRQEQQFQRERQEQYSQPKQEQQYQATAQQQQAFVQVQARSSLWLIILYMLTALPLGIFYFTLLVTALSTGFGLLAICIGLPLLYITMLLWLGMAEFERRLTMRWLNVYIPSMAPRRSNQSGLWRRLVARMTNPATWKSLAYLFVKFPFGIFSFTLVVSLFATAIGLVLLPFAYLVDTLLVSMKTFPAHVMANVFAYQIMGDGQLHFLTVLVLIAGAIAGIGLFVVSRYIVRWLAYLWGEFARVMLSRNSYGEPMDASLL